MDSNQGVDMLKTPGGYEGATFESGAVSLGPGS